MILEKITNNNISYRVKKGGHIFRDSAEAWSEIISSIFFPPTIAILFWSPAP